jgi:hypothetical protein
LGPSILADINDDWTVNILSYGSSAMPGVWLSGEERLFAWDINGQVLPGFPLYTPQRTGKTDCWINCPVVTDMDNNGSIEIVLVSQFREPSVSQLVVWDLSSSYQPAMVPWGTFMHDNCHSNTLPGWTYDMGFVVYLINYLFLGGPPPDPWEMGDVNCDGVINIADVVYLINYLFLDGPPPGCP